MPGFFNKMGTYMAGMGPARMAARFGDAAMGAFGRTTAGAIWGGAAGGLYGAMSDNTSVLGGMVGGAAMGAGLARYGGAGVLAGSMAGRGMSLGSHVGAYGEAFGRGVANMARRDARGARMMANQGFNRIRGLGKGVVRNVP